MTNLGLAGVPAPLNYTNVNHFQGLPEMGNTTVSYKGWNEFVLYGQEFTSQVLPNIKRQKTYYLYTAMTFDNGEESPISTDGDGKGLFVQNYLDMSLDGWYCIHDSSNLYGWSCYSATIPAEYFEPTKDLFVQFTQ